MHNFFPRQGDGFGSAIKSAAKYIIIGVIPASLALSGCLPVKDVPPAAPEEQPSTAQVQPPKPLPKPQPPKKPPVKKDPAPKTQDSPFITDPDASLSGKAEANFLYLGFSSAMHKGDTMSAKKFLDDLLDLNPNVEVVREAVSVFDFLNEQDKALDAASRGTLLYPDDLPLHLMYVDLLNRNGHPEKAASTLQGFVSRLESAGQNNDPESAKVLEETRLMLVRLHMDQGNYDKAYAALKNIPASQRSIAARFMEIEILEATGREAEANKLLLELVKEDPSLTEAWMALAAGAESDGNHKIAAGYYRKALESDNEPQIFTFMIQAMVKAKEYKQAEKMTLESAYGAETVLQCSLVFLEEKRYKEARRLLLAVQSNPEVAEDVLFYLGMMSYETGQGIKQALSKLEQIPEDSPNRSRLVYLKTLLYYKDNQIPQAITSAEMLNEEFPDNLDSWVILAELYNQGKEYAKAESTARAALKVWPNNNGLLYSLGMCLSSQGRNAEALKTVEQILVTEPLNSMALNFIGYMLADENRDLDRALNFIALALEQSPGNMHITDSLAWVHYRLGNYPEAWKAIQECIKLGGNDPLIWEHYGDIAAAMNKNAEARKAYNKALSMKPDNKTELMNKLKGLK